MNGAVPAIVQTQLATSGSLLVEIQELDVPCQQQLPTGDGQPNSPLESEEYRSRRTYICWVLRENPAARLPMVSLPV